MQFNKLLAILSLSFFFIFFLLPARAEDPSHIKDLIYKGDAQFENDNFQSSFTYYHKAFLQEPDNIEVNFKLGLAASAIRDFESAVMAFERVLIADPSFIQAKIEMAKSFYFLGAKETARQYFSEALEEKLPEDVRRSISAFLE